MNKGGTKSQIVINEKMFLSSSHLVFYKSKIKRLVSAPQRNPELNLTIKTCLHVGEGGKKTPPVGPYTAGTREINLIRLELATVLTALTAALTASNVH